MDSGPAKTSDERKVARAVAKLAALTEPTPQERARIRARIVANLNLDPAELGPTGPDHPPSEQAASAEQANAAERAGSAEQAGAAEPASTTAGSDSATQAGTAAQPGATKQAGAARQADAAERVSRAGQAGTAAQAAAAGHAHAAGQTGMTDPAGRAEQVGAAEQTGTTTQAGPAEQAATAEQTRAAKSAGEAEQTSAAVQAGSGAQAASGAGEGGTRPGGERHVPVSRSVPSGARLEADAPVRPPNVRGGRAPRGRRPGAGRRDREAPYALSGARARFAVAAVAVLALVGALAGMSLLLARDALPGDALYGIKRTAEAASLGLTFGEEPRALKHLEFATARVGEIETLARRYPNPNDAPVGGYLTALTDFDNDASAGSRQLIALATQTDGRQLESLRSWAAQQADRLHKVAPRLPPAARSREGVSLALLDKIVTRASVLLARMDCYQITSGSFDDVGALPATGACEQSTGIGPDSTVAPPSLPPSTDNSGAPADSTDEPLPPATPTPDLPLPMPGSTAALPSPTRPQTGPGAPPVEEPDTIELPLPLPTVDVPPLLPGLPGVRIGE